MQVRRTTPAMLPSANGLPQLDVAPAAPAVELPRKAVLLIEDEDSLGELMTHLLGRMQLDVLRAPDGTTALQLFTAQPERIGLALVDCRLPDMDGAEVCRRLREMRPKLPLLLTSGRDQRALLGVLSPGGPSAFLAKPYMPADVMRHVTALLNAAP